MSSYFYRKKSEHGAQLLVLVVVMAVDLAHGLELRRHEALLLHAIGAREQIWREADSPSNGSP